MRGKTDPEIKRFQTRNNSTTVWLVLFHQLSFQPLMNIQLKSMYLKRSYSVGVGKIINKMKFTPSFYQQVNRILFWLKKLKQKSPNHGSIEEFKTNSFLQCILYQRIHISIVWLITAFWICSDSFFDFSIDWFDIRNGNSIRKNMLHLVIPTRNILLLKIFHSFLNWRCMKYEVHKVVPIRQWIR